MNDLFYCKTDWSIIRIRNSHFKEHVQVQSVHHLTFSLLEFSLFVFSLLANTPLPTHIMMTYHYNKLFGPRLGAKWNDVRVSSIRFTPVQCAPPPGSTSTVLENYRKNQLNKMAIKKLFRLCSELMVNVVCQKLFA